jgi:hypothetical protein
MADMPSVRRPAAIAASAVVLLAGCTSTTSTPSSSKGAASGSSAATSVTPTTTATAATSSRTAMSASGTPSATGSAASGGSPADRLAALAAKAPSSLSATYTVSGGTAGTATVRIDLLPSGFRTTVTSGGATAMLISRRGGDTVSCTSSNCFTVATNGEGVPPSFDPQVQHMFTDYVPAFAGRPDELTISSVAAPAGAAGSCFGVKRSGSGPTTVVAGTYCLDAGGHVTYAAYPSGVLRLVSVNAVPTSALLRPPRPPTPVATATSHEPTD